MKKLAYFLISLLILLVCTGIGYVYVLYNLSAYSVYYAHHMPHAKGTNPEMVMAVDNLFWQEEPKESKLNITYRTFNDPNLIVVKDLGMYDVYVGVGPIYEGGIQVTRTNQVSDDNYYTDDSGRFIDYFGKKQKSDPYDDRPMTEADKKEAQELVDTIMKPIIATQKKPVINLQWLFNTKYQKRFSK